MGDLAAITEDRRKCFAVLVIEARPYPECSDDNIVTVSDICKKAQIWGPKADKTDMKEWENRDNNLAKCYFVGRQMFFQEEKPPGAIPMCKVSTCTAQRESQAEKA